MKENERGFTLIEMIGVLAIMSIMAAIIAPNVIKQMQRARQDAEDEVLNRLAESFEDYVLENRIIPQSGFGDTGDWSINIAKQADLARNDIYKNDFGCDRRYWFDPSTNLDGLTDDSDAYNQNTTPNISGSSTASTASPPKNPRAMIISDMTPGCTNGIDPATVPHTPDSNFSSTWDQELPALTEGDTLKIKRINLSRLFETVTLQSIPGTLFARKTYSTPETTDGVGGETNIYPVLTVEKNSHIFSVRLSTGGFEPILPSGGTVTVDIGWTSGENEFFSPEPVDVTAGSSTSSSVVRESTSDINIGIELTIDPAVPGTASSGYIDLLVEYQGKPQYKIEERPLRTIGIPADGTGTPEIRSFNVINGTEITFYGQSGNRLYSIIVKESDSFTYSPGPPAIWGR
ncbi:MAG: type II secretion system protein [Candidatus Anammoxibacter sp.]